jgi:hypothetical protein
MKFLKKQLTLIFLLLSFFTNQNVSASDVPARLQAAIFLKILEYDASVASKKGNNIFFHILLDNNTSKSGSQISSDFGQINGKTISGKKIIVNTIDISALSAKVKDDEAHFIYVPAGSTSGTINSASKLGESSKSPVLGGNESITRSGAAVGIGIEGGRPKIMINLKKSQSMGMRLASQLMKLATII